MSVPLWFACIGWLGFVFMTRRAWQWKTLSGRWEAIAQTHEDTVSKQFKTIAKWQELCDKLEERQCQE